MIPASRGTYRSVEVSAMKAYLTVGAASDKYFADDRIPQLPENLMGVVWTMPCTEQARWFPAWVRWCLARVAA